MASRVSIRTLLASLATALQGAPASATGSPEAARLQSIHAHLQASEADRLEVRRTLDALERRLTELRGRLDERRHSALTHAVLEQLLPRKARHRPVLPEDHAAARAREAGFKDVSSSYGAAIERVASPLPDARRIEIAGLSWWIPLDERSPDRPERAVAQGFPLRAILQTREVAIGGVMLDIGANLGRTSIPRVLLGDVRAVYAAEPEPRNYECLVRNVAEHHLQGFVLPDQVAIASRPGELVLRQSRYSGGHRIMHTAAKKPIDSVTVPAFPLDGWLQRLRVDPATVSFVKVDAQGSDVDVLKGASSLLETGLAAWQIEVDPALLAGAGTSVRELVDLVERHFTHFIDINPAAPGARVQATERLADTLGYIGSAAKKTDLIVFNG